MLRTKNTRDNVVSCVVDEKGTTTVRKGAGIGTQIRFRPHETTHDFFRRIVEHVHHIQPLPGPFADDAWVVEDLRVAQFSLKISYGAGMGIEISYTHRPGLEYLKYLPATEVTLDSVGDIYGDVFNAAIGIRRGQRQLAG